MTHAGGDLLETYSATIVFDAYADIREALFNPQLSRSFDRRSFADGNVRDGVVSISHGATHRARRRLENTQFRVDRLREYERELFPRILDNLLDRLVDEEQVDLFRVSALLSVVLAARRAGLDYDPDSIDQLQTLVGHVDAFSQAAAILDARDTAAVRAVVRQALADFEREFVRPSWARRLDLVQRYRHGELAEDALPHDILTVLLLHRDDADLGLADDGRVVREIATYVQGGTATSSQTLTNAVDLIFLSAEADSSLWARIVNDRLFAQRCIHETLRLRPTTPRMRRRAEADTTVAGCKIPRDALVILDAGKANRDRRVFGDDADTFNPDRVLDDAVAGWGLSFGAGPHQCPGRSVAGGLPVPPDFHADDDHLFGLVALMLQEVVRRGVRPDPVRKPVPDLRTERFTRWAEYPVRFGADPEGVRRFAGSDPARRAASHHHG
jgi:cytochrome P450